MGSGSGKPGRTFKMTVLSTDITKASIEAEEEDISYLVPGNSYMVQVTPVGGGGGGRGNKPVTQSDT